MHGLGDGQLDMEGAGEDACAAGGLDSFGDVFHMPDDFREGVALGELYADVMVARLGAAAGGYEVADAGEAAEG